MVQISHVPRRFDIVLRTLYVGGCNRHVRFERQFQAATQDRGRSTLHGGRGDHELRHPWCRLPAGYRGPGAPDRIRCPARRRPGPHGRGDCLWRQHYSRIPCLHALPCDSARARQARVSHHRPQLHLPAHSRQLYPVLPHHARKRRRPCAVLCRVGHRHRRDCPRVLYARASTALGKWPGLPADGLARYL